MTLMLPDIPGYQDRYDQQQKQNRPVCKGYIHFCVKIFCLFVEFILKEIYQGVVHSHQVEFFASSVFGGMVRQTKSRARAIQSSFS